MSNHEKSFRFVFEDKDKMDYDRIDSQHQQIINVLDCLAKTLYSNEFEALYRNLIECCTQHFADEESIMESNEWIGLENHREEHLKILEKMWQYRPAIIGFDKSQSFIKTIFGPLIIVHDREFSKWVRKNPKTEDILKEDKA